MAETPIPVIRVLRVGVLLAPDFSDGVSTDGGGDFYLPANDGNVIVQFLYVGAGTSAGVSVVPYLVVAGQDLAPTELEVAEQVVGGPYPPALFNRPDGSVLIECDGDLVLRGLRI